MTSSQKLSLWLVFPHQLFDQLPEGVETVAVIEEPLFFQQYAFHKQKLVFHRATIKKSVMRSPLWFNVPIKYPPYKGLGLLRWLLD